MNALTLLVDAANAESKSSVTATDDGAKNGKAKPMPTASDSTGKGPTSLSATASPGTANAIAAALAARENAMYQQIHKQQGAAAKLRHLEEIRMQEEKLSKDHLMNIMLQHEREQQQQQQAAAHQAAIMRLAVGMTSQQEGMMAQDLRLQALAQQDHQETLARLALAKGMGYTNGSGDISGLMMGKTLSKDIASHKYERQDTALQEAILKARANEELIKHQVELQHKAQEQREIEQHLIQEHHRQEQQKALMLQLMSKTTAGPSFPGSGGGDESAILRLLEERERQRLIAQHSAMNSTQSAQLELQQQLQQHLQSQQTNRERLGERADLIGSVFAKAAAAPKNQNSHHSSTLAHEAPMPSHVASSMATAEEQEKQKLLRLQQLRQNNQEAFQSSGIMMQQAVLHQQRQESIKPNHEIQHGQDSVSRDAALRDSKSTILPCRARGMPMDHNVKTAYFVVPDNVKHGTELLCSYFACRNSGIKFRYCVFCKLPVAKRNFAKRHRHSGKISEGDEPKDPASDGAADTTGDEESKSVCTLSSPQTQSQRKLEDVPHTIDEKDASDLSKVDTSTDEKSSVMSASDPTPGSPQKINECKTDNCHMVVSTACCNASNSEESMTPEAGLEEEMTTANPQSTAANHALAKTDSPLVSVSPTPVVTKSKRQKAWEELLFRRPETKLPGSVAMVAWIRDVLRVSDFENDIDSDGSFSNDGDAPVHARPPVDVVSSEILKDMRPLPSKKSKTKALLSRKEQEDMEERNGDNTSMEANNNNESDSVEQVEEEIGKEDIAKLSSKKRHTFSDDASTSSEESVEDLRVRKKHRH